MAKKRTENIYIEYGASQITEKEVIQRVKDIWVENGRKINEMTSLEVYIKPEENKAYYVINEDITGDVDLW